VPAEAMATEVTDRLVARVMRLQQVATCVSKGIHTAEVGGAPPTVVEHLYNLLSKSALRIDETSCAPFTLCQACRSLVNDSTLICTRKRTTHRVAMVCSPLSLLATGNCRRVCAHLRAFSRLHNNSICRFRRTD